MAAASALWLWPLWWLLVSVVSLVLVLLLLLLRWPVTVTVTVTLNLRLRCSRPGPPGPVLGACPCATLVRGARALGWHSTATPLPLHQHQPGPAPAGLRCCWVTETEGTSSTSLGDQIYKISLEAQRSAGGSAHTAPARLRLLRTPGYASSARHI